MNPAWRRPPDNSPSLPLDLCAACEAWFGDIVTGTNTLTRNLVADLERSGLPLPARFRCVRCARVAGEIGAP